ncbi:FkbM family methyltransferase [Mesorhizobium sp. USDA 4775]|nr:FkbM family methyltransferase [Mesorhizobium huakuii 7653R]
MGASFNQAGFVKRIFTSHGTTLFVDTSSGELRHGLMEYSPNNVLLTKDGKSAHIRFVDGPTDIVYFTEYSAISGSKRIDGIDALNLMPDNTLTIVDLPRNKFGLVQNGTFLSARSDGRITLSAPLCRGWENFHFRNDASEVSGVIVSHRIDGKIITFFIQDRTDIIQSILFGGDFYERDTLDLIRDRSTPGKVFVDIGANIGNHSIFMSKFCSPSEVIVFEPNPKAIEILKLNVLLNACANINTSYLGLALGSKAAQMRVFSPDPNNMGRAQMLDDDDGNVKCVAGDLLLQQKPVGLLKIDVEGSEFEVLRGMQGTIETWRPNILIEVWPQSQQDLFSWCDSFRYVVQETFPTDNNYFLAPIERQS